MTHDDDDDDDEIRHGAKLRNHRSSTATKNSVSLDIMLTEFSKL